MAVFLLTACDFPKIQKCHQEMKTSQGLMVDLSEKHREDLAFAKKTHEAVKRTQAVCTEAGRTEEVSKIRQAEREIAAHVQALEERATREKRPRLTEAELAELEKKGDATCPRGQQYEHHQNKKLINCTGPQLVEMNWAQASEYYARRGFKRQPRGSTLRFERGAQVIDFEFTSPNSSTRAPCVAIVADPGIPWQETVTRATGTQPMRLKLGQPVPTKTGQLDLLVEGGPEQYTVKLGTCKATPGQKPVEEAPPAP